MPSAVSLGPRAFTLFVPTWMMILSGSFLGIGLMKSSKSSVVAPGKDFTTTLLALERLHPRMSWMMESPTITVTGLFVILVGPVYGSFDLDVKFVEWFAFLEIAEFLL